MSAKQEVINQQNKLRKKLGDGFFRETEYDKLFNYKSSSTAKKAIVITKNELNQNQNQTDSNSDSDLDLSKVDLKCQFANMEEEEKLTKAALMLRQTKELNDQSKDKVILMPDIVDNRPNNEINEINEKSNSNSKTKPKSKPKPKPKSTQKSTQSDSKRYDKERSNLPDLSKGIVFRSGRIINKQLVEVSIKVGRKEVGVGKWNPQTKNWQLHFKPMVQYKNKKVVKTLKQAFIEHAKENASSIKEFIQMCIDSYKEELDNNLCQALTNKQTRCNNRRKSKYYCGRHFVKNGDQKFETIQATKMGSDKNKESRILKDILRKTGGMNYWKWKCDYCGANYTELGAHDSCGERYQKLLKNDIQIIYDRTSSSSSSSTTGIELVKYYRTQLVEMGWLSPDMRSIQLHLYKIIYNNCLTGIENLKNKE